MKFIDINKRFTEIVAEYIAKGYTINIATTSGSQGEIGKVDLTDGAEIIRVYVDTFHDYRENIEGVELVVGRSTDNIKPHGADKLETVWSTHLEVLSKERFYRIGNGLRSDYYGTEAEAKAAAEKRIARWRARESAATTQRLTFPEAAEIGKRFILRKGSAKRVNVKDVHVNKYISRHGDVEYIVAYKNHAYKLH